MYKLLRVLVPLGLLGLVLGVTVLLGARSASRSALRSYESVLRANGEKLTFAELSPRREANSIDSHAVITNAMAKLAEVRLNPELLEPRKYCRPGQAIVAWRETDLSWMNLAASGRGGTWEELGAQLRSVESTLQEIREALKKPALDGGPYTNVFATRRVNFVAIRKAAQWLVGAAEEDLHRGRMEEALCNLEALGALARMERDECTLVAQMIRVSVARLGLSLTWEALQAPGWTEPQLEHLQRIWEQVDLLEAVERGFVGERAGGYDVFTRLRHSSGTQAARLFDIVWISGPPSAKRTLEKLLMYQVYFPAYKLTCIDEDELFYLRIMQESLRPLR